MEARDLELRPGAMENDEDATQEWEFLESTLERVVEEMMGRDMQQKPFAQGKLIPRDDYIGLYEQMYYLLCHDRGHVYGSKLYNKYKHLLQRSIHSIFYAQENSSEKEGSNVGLAVKTLLLGKGEEGLETFLEKFKTFKHKMLVFSHIFAYMERYYVPRMSLPSLEEVLKTELNEQVLKKVTQQLKNELANLMDKRRNGKSVNEDLFGEVVALFLEMSSTSSNMTQDKQNVKILNDLEAFLLQRTRAYYTKMATQWPQDALEKKAEQALQYEKDFTEFFLPEKSVSNFEEKLVDIMGEIVSATALKNAEKIEVKKPGGNLESSVKASLNCSTHHKLQDSSKSSITDAFRTANV